MAGGVDKGNKLVGGGAGEAIAGQATHPIVRSGCRTSRAGCRRTLSKVVMEAARAADGWIIHG
jgi:hypothetical protein